MRFPRTAAPTFSRTTMLFVCAHTRRWPMATFHWPEPGPIRVENHDRIRRERTDACVAKQASDPRSVDERKQAGGHEHRPDPPEITPWGCQTRPARAPVPSRRPHRHRRFGRDHGECYSARSDSHAIGEMRDPTVRPCRDLHSFRRVYAEPARASCLRLVRKRRLPRFVDAEATSCSRTRRVLLTRIHLGVAPRSGQIDHFGSGLLTGPVQNSMPHLPAISRSSSGPAGSRSGGVCSSGTWTPASRK